MAAIQALMPPPVQLDILAASLASRDAAALRLKLSSEIGLRAVGKPVCYT
jgi:hypothetical protein